MRDLGDGIPAAELPSGHERHNMNAEEFVKAIGEKKTLLNVKRNIRASPSLIYAVVLHAADITLEFEGMRIESDNQISLFNSEVDVGLIETNDWVIA